MLPEKDNSDFENDFFFKWHVLLLDTRVRGN
jgi:hypothetical protein